MSDRGFLRGLAEDRRRPFRAKPASVESDEHGFPFEPDAEPGLDSFDDARGKIKNLLRRSTAEIDQRKRVARRDSRCSPTIAFRETCLLDEPCRRDLRSRCDAGAGFSRELRRILPRNLPDPGELILGHHRVLEETACAPAIRVAIDEQHSFVLTQPTNGLRRSGERWLYSGWRHRIQCPFQLGVFDLRRAATSLSRYFTRVTR